MFIVSMKYGLALFALGHLDQGSSSGIYSTVTLFAKLRG